MGPTLLDLGGKKEEEREEETKKEKTEEGEEEGNTAHRTRLSSQSGKEPRLEASCRLHVLFAYLPPTAPAKTAGAGQQLWCLSNINNNPRKQIHLSLSLVYSGCCSKSLLLCDPEQLHLQAGGQGAFRASLAGSFEDKNAKVGARRQWYTHPVSFPIPQTPLSHTTLGRHFASLLSLQSPGHKPIARSCPSPTDEKLSS